MPNAIVLTIEFKQDFWDDPNITDEEKDHLATKYPFQVADAIDELLQKSPYISNVSIDSID